MAKNSIQTVVSAQGVYAALATPRKTDAIEADAAALLDYIDVIVQAGVDGLVLFGATGEFVHFDIAERVRVLALAKKRSRVPLLVNVSHSSFDAAVDLAENAIENKVAGVLLTPPYFFRYSDDQIFSFYQQFAKTLNDAVPIYLYHLPFFTNPLSADLLTRLMQTGWFHGVKDSSGEWPLFEALKTAQETQPFQLLMGHESIYARGRSQGANGVVSGLAAAIPEVIVALDRALVVNDLDRAASFDRHVQDFVAWVNQFPTTIAIKQAAVVRGWKLNHLAIPFDDTTNTRIAAFRNWFEEWLPPVLAECAVRT